jgi:hypothetical protein
MRSILDQMPVPIRNAEMSAPETTVAGGAALKGPPRAYTP